MISLKVEKVEKVEKGDRPLFLGLSLLVIISEKEGLPPFFKKGACPLFLLLYEKSRKKRYDIPDLR